MTRDASIVLAGQAGQGIETIESVLTRVLLASGYNVFATKEYMSRVRGGQNSTEIRIGPTPVQAHVDRIDVLMPLDQGSLERLLPRISKDTLVLCDEGVCVDAGMTVNVPVTSTATAIGNKIFTNTVAMGVVCGLLGADVGLLREQVRKVFSTKDPGIIEKNVAAVNKGNDLGRELVSSGKVELSTGKTGGTRDTILVNGAEAIALGAIAGGCNFIASYPMSPSTAVLASLAAKTQDFDIIAEQAEDEIAAVNMAIGAWYAGAKAMITTSGGGFALMTEGVSLAGMIESPLVLHVAQRPGPATGLPTRTEQGDLNLVLHAGHGEFPRVIFAPATIEDGFTLAAKAFNIADKYQVPVFLLSDQYYVDSYYNVPPFNDDGIEVVDAVVETQKDYKRYTFVPDGISPRGVPGHGDGLVLVDSDEHDEEGHITEDFNIRTAMVDKRLRKLDAFDADAVSPHVHGKGGGGVLVVGWGSTYHAIHEALQRLDDDRVAHLHFTQLYPLPPGTRDRLEAATTRILIEGNATGHFGQLLGQHAGVTFHHEILKYSGEPFSVEELATAMTNILGGA